MEAYLSIQEIALRKISVPNIESGYIIYPSLFDMYSKTREDLDVLVNILSVNELFTFSNTGTYAGIDHRTKMHFTYDDGRDSIAWLMHLMRTLNSYYLATRNSIRIHIVKDDILDASLMEINSGERLATEKANEFIRLYVNTLEKFTKTCRANGLINTRIKPIENSKYKIIKIHDNFVICKKKTVR